MELGESEVFLVIMSLTNVEKNKRGQKGYMLQEKWEQAYILVEVKNVSKCLRCKVERIQCKMPPEKKS